MIPRLAALLAAIAAAGSLMAAEPIVAKVSALSSGSLLLNGKQVDLKSIETELGKLKAAKGEVWYYRENPQSEPHPNAMAVIQLVVKHQLPISMSTKPDFSDYVDRDGRSKPRRP
jgi:hypothetical protein